jgi:hypothetical protein
MMSESTRKYLPAAGHDRTLPLCDPIVKLLGGDRARGYTCNGKAFDELGLESSFVEPFVLNLLGACNIYTRITFSLLFCFQLDERLQSA